MPDDTPPEIDRRRVRLGILFLVVVVLVALTVAVTVDDALARIVMIGIALFTVGRTFLLVRSLRSSG